MIPARSPISSPLPSSPFISSPAFLKRWARPFSSPFLPLPDLSLPSTPPPPRLCLSPSFCYQTFHGISLASLNGGLITKFHSWFPISLYALWHQLSHIQYSWTFPLSPPSLFSASFLQSRGSLSCLIRTFFLSMLSLSPSFSFLISVLPSR